ncbi:MAG: HIT domain-containing protein, partial [Deltaproteobacteria bacterium]
MIYPNKPCPFCTLDPARILTSAIMDGFPISPGHALINPKRHIARLFEAAREERDALFDLVEQVRQQMLDANVMQATRPIPVAVCAGYSLTKRITGIMADLKTYIKQFAHMRRAPNAVFSAATMKRAPHKLILLLAVLDLVARFVITTPL